MSRAPQCRFATLLHRLGVISGVCVVVGCGAPERVNRATANAVVPEHARRDEFIGAWRSQATSEIALIIRANEKGQVLISSPENEVWDEVVNNVRFVSDELHYDCYYYFKGPEDFSDMRHGSADHPFSGQRNRMKLSLVEGAPSLLQMSLEMSDYAELPELLERASE